jgi:hypothetical protein
LCSVPGLCCGDDVVSRVGARVRDFSAAVDSTPVCPAVQLTTGVRAWSVRVEMVCLEDPSWTAGAQRDERAAKAEMNPCNG